jgi:hypothetical protein
MNSLCSVKWPRGRLAQLEERLVRNEEVASSSLVPSTKIPIKQRFLEVRPDEEGGHFKAVLSSEARSRSAPRRASLFAPLQVS